MATKLGQVMSAAQAGFRQLDAELIASESRNLRRVYSVSDGGNGDIAHDFTLDLAYRLVYVRCHFASGAGSATFKIRVKSRLSADWDAVLETFAARGTGADVHFKVPGYENLEPSPWTFQAGDSVRCEWVNPASGVMKWALEVGLAMAS